MFREFPKSQSLGEVSCVNLRFLRRRRRLLFDDFDYLARISLFVILEHEILGLERIALVVELDRTGDSFKVFDVPHGRGDLGATWPLAAVGFDPPFNRLDPYRRSIVAVHGEGLDVPAEALLEFLGKGRAFRISVRRAGDGRIIAAGHCAPADIDHLRRIQTVRSHVSGLYAALAELL